MNVLPPNHTTNEIIRNSPTLKKKQNQKSCFQCRSNAAQSFLFWTLVRRARLGDFR